MTIRERGRAIDDDFRVGPVATDTRPKGVFQANAVGDLAELIGFTHYLGYAGVGLVLALVATTTVMAVQDRVREHAVLQTIGFSGPRIFGMVVAESLLVSLAGGALGVGLALGTLAWAGPAVGTEGVTIAFVPSAGLAGLGLGVAAWSAPWPASSRLGRRRGRRSSRPCATLNEGPLISNLGGPPACERAAHKVQIFMWY